MANNQQYGYSLLELMIVMLMSAIFMFSLIRAHLLLVRNHQRINNWLQLANRSQFLINYLGVKIRMAGNFYCDKGMFKKEEIKAWGLPGKFGDLLMVRECLKFRNFVSVHVLRFDVEDTGRRTNIGSMVTGLYQTVDGGRRELLAEGVGKMKISWGLSKNNRSMKRYLRTLNVENWRLVKSVILKLTLLGKNGSESWQMYTAFRNS